MSLQKNVRARRDVPVGVPLDLSTDGNELYWDIWRKLQVRQSVRISCFISCFSTIMA